MVQRYRSSGLCFWVCLALAMCTGTVTRGVVTPPAIDGNLEDASLMVIDLRGGEPAGCGNGLLHNFEASGSRGVACFQQDAYPDGNPLTGPDGFRDSSLSGVTVPGNCDFPDCVDQGVLYSEVRTPFNVGNIVVIFVADDDADIEPLADDTSYIYVGFDIYNGFGRVVGNGWCSDNPAVACEYDSDCLPSGVCEGDDADSHRIDFIDVPDGLGQYGPCDDGIADFLTCDELEPPQITNCSPGADGIPDFLGVPFDVDGDGHPGDGTETVGRDRWREIGCDEPLWEENDNEEYRLTLYSCAEGDGTGLTEKTLIGSAYLEAMAGGTAIQTRGDGAVPVAWIETFPGPGTSADDISELMSLGRDERDVEFIIRHVETIYDNANPGDTYENNRFRLAQGGLRAMADTSADSGEDRIWASWLLPLPDIEVTKQVRCEGEDDFSWGELEEALPGSTVDFRIEIENTGNVDLAVSLEDVLEGLPAGFTATPVDDSLSVTLYRPENGAGEAVDYYNAADFVPPFKPEFFGDPLDPDDQGFLDYLDGTESYLGILKGVQACVDPPVSGDRVVIIFQAVIDGDACAEKVSPDAKNTVTVIGDPDIPPVDNGNEVTDTDDADVNLLCRDISLTKTAAATDIGGAVPIGKIPTDPARYPVTVTYTYYFENNGELRETVTFGEKYLCDDVYDLQNDVMNPQDIVWGSCPVCLGSAGELVPPGGNTSTTCTITFNDVDALLALAAKDNGRADCTTVEPPICYKNCATATVEAFDLAEECRYPDTIGAEEVICLGGCEVQVTKEVKCKEDPDSAYGPIAETMPDEDLTFRITVENIGSTDILHLCITDDLDCETWVIGSVPPFPLDGTRYCMDLVADPFKPGDIKVYTFDVHVPEASTFSVPTPDVDCTNCVTVEGYTDEDADLEAAADCEDGPACAEIDVKVADIDCEKLVCADFDADGTCDTEFTNNLGFGTSEVVYPLRLIYRFTAINPASRSEVGLENVTVTDEHFVDDFLNAGMTVENCRFCPSDPCVLGEDNTTASLADLGVPPPDQTAGFDCWVEVPSKAVWDSAPDPPFGTCYNNTATVNADPKDIDTENCKNSVSSTCTAEICISEPCTCTKANFDIWNQNEVKFSGTHRCICHWDQAFISEYEASNHMLRENLQTDKGKARIRGLRSTVVCGEGSRDAPLLGLAAKRMTFASGDAMMSGMPMVGAGVDPNRYGQILYNIEDADPPPPELAGAPAGADRAVRVAQRPAPSNPLAATAELPPSPATIGRKGSFLVYPKVELKWDAAGNLIQDTFITLTNDFGLPAGDSMIVQLYFVRTCNAWVDATIKLTQNEPTYWSAYTGNPKGVQPFTALSDGIEDDDDPRNPGGKRLRGYILAWAINNDGQEINWNHLTGSAMIINYLDANAWEYESWGFRAVDADSTNGEALLEPFGQIDLDTVEYEAPPAMLLLDFYATGTMLWSHDQMSGQISPSFIFDTDLTLWPPIKDLRK